MKGGVGSSNRAGSDCGGGTPSIQVQRKGVNSSSQVSCEWEVGDPAATQSASAMEENGTGLGGCMPVRSSHFLPRLPVDFASLFAHSTSLPPPLLFFLLQAVMASDFAIAQFAFLERLLLVHGHWCYRRIAGMVRD